MNPIERPMTMEEAATAREAKTADDAPAPFSLNLAFDGNGVSVDHCDGSDLEYYLASTRAEVAAVVLEQVRTAMSPQENDEEG